MPYIGNVVVDFNVDTDNINNSAVTAVKLSPSVGSNGQVLSVDANGALQWTTDAAGMPTSGGTFTGNVLFNDDVKARFGHDDGGSGGDVDSIQGQLWWDETNNYFNLGLDTGSTHKIDISAQTVEIRGVNRSSNMAIFRATGATDLFHGANKKFETSNTGVTVTGTVVATAYTGDGSNLTGIAALTGSTNNTICTVTGANAITGESTLLWDGAALSTYRDSATTYGPGILGHHQRGTIASPSVSQTDDTLLNIVAKGYDGDEYHDAARIDFVVGSGTPGNNDMPGSILFKTTGDGQASSSTRVTIQQNGNLLLDSSSTLLIPDAIQHVGDTNTQIRFPAADTVSVETGGSERLSITSTSTIFKNTGYVSFNGNGYIRTDSSGYLRLQMGSNGTMFTNSSNNELARIDSSGNVGIGTTSPDQILHLATTGTCKLRLEDKRTSIADGSQYGVIQFEHQDSSGVGVAAEFGAVMTDTSNGSTDLQFITGNPSSKGERLRITSNGELWVGTTSGDTTYQTHIKHDTYGLLKLESTNTGADASYLDLYHNSASPADDDQLGIIGFKGKNSADEQTTYAQVRGFSGDVTDATEDGYLTFNTRDAGTFDERLRITSAGDVNIGNAADNTAIHASGLFNGATPKFEIKLGAAANSYTRLINITNPGAQSGSETLGRVGIKLSLGSEASSGESNKSGIIYAESTSGYNNGTALCFATSNAERLRITSTGETCINDVDLIVGYTQNTQAQINFFANSDNASSRYARIRKNYNSPFNLEYFASTSDSDQAHVFYSDLTTERLRITSLGEVTIGTGNGGNSMTEFGSNVGGLTLDDIGVSHTGLRLSHGADDTYLIQGGDGNFYISQYGTGDMVFGVGASGNERLRIRADDGQINLGGNFTQTAHKVCIQGGTSSQLLVRGQEADIWLNSTGGSETKWRILGSTGGSTHRFRIYDQTNSRDVIEIYGQNAGNENKTENSDVHINYGLMVGMNRTKGSTGYGSNGVYHPVVSGGEGECVFSIDPSWSKSELRKFFNSDNVSWLNIGDAPGGYAIQVNNATDVGGNYGSGFPYIPIDDGDSFRMECWIRTHNGSQNHYMGSIEYDKDFDNGTGNPGSFGYWCMVNQTINSTSWTRVTGTIGPNHGSSYGEFRSGFTGGARKYWTPQALFNYTNNSGDRICYISGWRVIRLRHRGTHVFEGLNVTGSKTFQIPHPLTSKKDTHELVHSSVESPQCDNIYRGKITLSSGTATVNLDTNSNMTDGTFVALNTNIQCHTSNETGWGAVKGSVSGNILTITAQDNTSTDTISWIVVGERKDEQIKRDDRTNGDGELIVELPKAQNVPEGGDIPMVAPVGIVNSKPNT